MAKHKPPIGDTTGPAFLSEAIGDEQGPGEAQAPAAPKISGTLKAPLVIDPRHRARDYPGSQRLRVRAAGQEAHEVAYVAVPIGPDAREQAEAAYFAGNKLSREQVSRVIVTSLPD